MKFEEAMKRLKALGTERTAATYRRHGARQAVFGVLFGDLAKLAKEIGVDQALALRLHAAGNHDALNLALMVADPAQLTADLADRWARAVGGRGHAMSYAQLVVRSPAAGEMLERWTADQDEHTRLLGYYLLACLARHEPARFPAPVARRWLARIEKEIHASANLARDGMNAALIALGTFCEGLADDAIAAAGRIGKVEVDHGETACETPDAADYIRKSLARQGAKGGKTASKKKPATKKATTKKGVSR